MNKFYIWTGIVITLLITNLLEWTTIPWLLLKIVAFATVCVWVWAIIVATILIIINGIK